MLETLKFVYAAVCRNDLQPTLTHFRIQNGTITAYNGLLSIRAPLAVGLDCAPVAGQFLKAVKACEETVSLHVEGAKLCVRSGKFKTYVDLATDPSRFPDLEPTGEIFPVRAPVIGMLKKLAPFMGTDEARLWQCGVLFCNQSVYTTNNISIVEHWSAAPFPVIASMPAEAVRELIRLNVEPVSVQADAQRVVFHLPGGAWVGARVLAYEWPDLQAIIASVAGVPVKPLDPALLDAVEKVSQFADTLGKVYFHNGAVSTVPLGQDGTTVETEASPGKGIHRASLLLGLRDVAQTIGFENYPAPIPFFGEGIRGVFQGYAPTP